MYFDSLGILLKLTLLSSVDQSQVDKSTEEWLDTIEGRLDYRKWYCGHYHTDKKVDRITIMFEGIEEFMI